jgi:hypothetical protein
MKVAINFPYGFCKSKPKFEKDFIETDKKVNLMESALSGRILRFSNFQMILINGFLL